MYLTIKQTRSVESFYGTLPGTLQETMEKVSAAVRAKFSATDSGVPEGERSWANVIGTFSDRVIYSIEKGKNTNYFVAPWTLAADGSCMLQPETEIKMTFIAQPVDGDGKVMALESGRRNSRNDEASLLSIVEQAVYLLGKDKVLEQVKNCRQGPNVKEPDDDEAMEQMYGIRKPKMTRKFSA